MGKIDCKLDRFGVIRNSEGSILNSCINIKGLDISEAKLTDWLNQGLNYYLDEVKELPEGIARRKYLLQEVTSLFTLIHLLLKDSSYDLDILPELNLSFEDGVMLDVSTEINIE